MKPPRPSRSFFPSYAQENAGRIQELETEIKNTLEVIPDVSKARVLLSLPSSFSTAGALHDMANDSSYVASASVVVLSDAPQNISQKNIQELVAGAAAELSASNVWVFVYPTQRDVPTRDARIALGGIGGISKFSSLQEKWKPYFIALIAAILGGAIVVLYTSSVRMLRRRNRRNTNQ